MFINAWKDACLVHSVDEISCNFYPRCKQSRRRDTKDFFSSTEIEVHRSLPKSGRWQPAITSKKKLLDKSRTKDARKAEDETWKSSSQAPKQKFSDQNKIMEDEMSKTLNCFWGTGVWKICGRWSVKATRYCFGGTGVGNISTKYASKAEKEVHSSDQALNKSG